MSLPQGESTSPGKAGPPPCTLFPGHQQPQYSCSQVLHSGVKPGFPKTIKTDNPDVLRAARHSAERFNNCSNDVFLFKESRVRRALVQVVKGLKFMLDVDIGRTTCKKTGHPSLDDCDFQTNRTLKRDGINADCRNEGAWGQPQLTQAQPCHFKGAPAPQSPLRIGAWGRVVSKSCPLLNM
ncbi:cystatin-F isoform X1 [Vicugna pacos]|uniref:Cystatin-F isoform X1 n=1 Tax=Vicugna pacos TaxID=30538 RepID=A0ABM5BTK6_VICPA